MTKTWALIVVTAALTACVSTSEVVPMGKDSYMISSSSNGGPGGNGAHVSRIEAAKAANRYCDAKGLHMVVRNLGGTTFGLSGGTSELIFSCVTSDDPEYKRPDLRQAPTTVIEDQRK